MHEVYEAQLEVKIHHQHHNHVSRISRDAPGFDPHAWKERQLTTLQFKWFKSDPFTVLTRDHDRFSSKQAGQYQTCWLQRKFGVRQKKKQKQNGDFWRQKQL